MSFINKRRLVFTLLFVFVLGVALWVARMYVLTQIKSKLEAQLFALRDSGYTVSYDSITVNTQQNEVTVYRLSIKRELDSAVCATTDFFSASFIKADGFKLLPLVFKRKLSFQTITLDSPRLVLAKNFFKKRDPEQAGGDDFSISISHLRLPNLRFTYLDSSSCNPNTTLTSNARIDDFVLAFYKDRQPYFNISSFYGDSINIILPNDYYTIKIRETRLNLELGIFDMDTLRIVPHLGKIEFGRKKNMEADRFEGMIPYLNLYGLRILKEDTFAIESKKMTVQMFLKIFRDKRQPFRNPYRPLPAEALGRLPFGLKIDSLLLNKSYFEYEEFAKGADSAGRIFFDNVYASVANIQNLSKEPSAVIKLKAAGDLMGQGNLEVVATVPLGVNEKTAITATLTDMDFQRFNEILEPHMRMRAESGRLHEMKTKFEYDNDRSSGTVDMRYAHLKLVSFRREEQIEKKIRKKKRKGKDDVDQEQVEKSPVKTFVLNTFILKNNSNGNDEETRSGQINFERDKRRSMFNFWAKSLMSGIKSAYNLDKLEDSRLKKMLDKTNGK